MSHPETPDRPIVEANARPPQYATTAQWLVAGFNRQKPAAIGALLAAWTGLAFSLWLAVGGVIAGAVLGALGPTSLGIGSLGANTGTGVFFAVVFAILGGIAGLLAIDILLILHPLQLLAAIVSGAVLSTAALLIYVHSEPWLMRTRGYREPSRREKVRIYPLLLNAAIEMKLAVVPEVWISDAQKPGAWAHTRAIVVTHGLLGDYDASEAPPKSDFDQNALAAILAHELHHWDSGDVVGLAVVTATFWPLVLIINLISWVRQRGEWLGILLWAIFWPVWVATKLVVVPLMAKRSRQYEYDADARAASLGDQYRLGLRRALDELSPWDRPRTGWEDVLMATHPPTEHRLERLEAAWQPQPATHMLTVPPKRERLRRTPRPALPAEAPHADGPPPSPLPDVAAPIGDSTRPEAPIRPPRGPRPAPRKPSKPAGGRRPPKRKEAS